MLICNLIDERYRLIKNLNFGVKCKEDILWDMFVEDQKIETDCLSFDPCYVPVTCIDTASISCALTVTGTFTNPTDCSTLSVTITQT